MPNFMRLPIWSIYILIIMTVILSFLILLRIWFPQYMPDDMFMKIFWTYIVLIASSAVIAKMTEYVANMKKQTD